MAESRFSAIDPSEFICQNENKNTARKTLTHLKLMGQFLSERHNEGRSIDKIPPTELDKYLSEFVVNIRTPKNEEYEPSTVRGMISSFDRHLRRHRYGSQRESLKAKKSHLKSLGKGAKPMKADPLTDQDIDKLYECNHLGKSTPTSLMNTLWFLNTLHFGIRGGSEEHRRICWGDVKLQHDPEKNLDYLEYHERITKTRTDDEQDSRIAPPRMYATPIVLKDVPFLHG
ncbi:hypothetical protein FSP39_005788 [Pinctada imbricata]|uniref:ZMYM2-like/QRICH1 C-terminal domain-containing protein n=1 Tax=Pinctada imbricata TaxID=66713 RepID=A0AA88Y3C0_PINIB|nr:hypothetical protein FSP39_005788 [Pinctada imbricata]